MWAHICHCLWRVRWQVWTHACGLSKQKKGGKNHLIQEFHEYVQGKKMPSWSFKHFGLARLVVLGRDEVLELLKFYLPKCSNAEELGRKVVLDMVVLREPTRNK
jgi:hypothetical protein